MSHYKTYVFTVYLQGGRGSTVFLEKGEKVVLDALEPGQSPWIKFDEALNLIRDRDGRQLVSHTHETDYKKEVLFTITTERVVRSEMAERIRKAQERAHSGSRRPGGQLI